MRITRRSCIGAFLGVLAWPFSRRINGRGKTSAHSKISDQAKRLASTFREELRRHFDESEGVFLDSLHIHSVVYRDNPVVRLWVKFPGRSCELCATYELELTASDEDAVVGAQRVAKRIKHV